ncbi:MAG: histidine kinase dimerization/phospho-acceptor domain-containing protein [Candidatus Zixiibacteriota bacterium]
MKRALKIVSRKQNMVGGKPRASIEEAGFGDALSKQHIAHIEQNQSTLNTINELARTISHYLNSPLTVLMGKVELLSQVSENGEASKEDMRRFAEDCKREIFRIDSIVKAFLDLCEVQYKTYPPGVKLLDVEREIENRVKETSFLR